ncbi:hypothetical protein ACLKA6_002070 [Drosophila palustris]
MSEALGSFDYCDPKLCKNGVKHVACDTELKFAERCSDNARLLEIDQSAQEFITNTHNFKRHKWAMGYGNVWVKACRMASLRWNETLANLAEYNVMQCRMNRDECHNTDVHKNSGQNLYVKNFKAGNAPHTHDLFKMAIDNWETEGRNLNAKFIAEYPKNYRGKPIGQIAILLQERNQHVGCAASNYQDADGNDTYLVACNYGTNNLAVWPIYRICRKGGLQCRTDVNPHYQALCSLSELVDFN